MSKDGTKEKTTNELAQDRTDMASDRTRMAADRTLWADDRTLIAWIRTSLALIGFGFGVGRARSPPNCVAARHRRPHAGATLRD